MPAPGRYSKLKLSVCGSLACILASVVSPAALAGGIKVGITLADDIYLAPIYAAEQLGLFKSAGLAVKRIPIRNIEVGLEALAASQVDLIDAPGPAIALLGAEKLAGKIVATNASGFFGWTAIVKRSSGYLSLADLAGKKTGIGTDRSLASMAATLAMERGKVDFPVTAVGAGALIPMLRQGKIDAAISSAMLGLREVQSGRARIVYDLGLGTETYAVSTLIASNSLMQKRPEELRAFLRALSGALAHMQKDRKWSIELLKRYTSITDTELVTRMYDNIIRRMNPSYSTTPKSLFTAKALAARAWKTSELHGLDLTPHYTNTFLTPAK